MITFAIQGALVGFIVWLALSIEEYISWSPDVRAYLLMEWDWIIFTVMTFTFTGAFFGGLFGAAVA